MLALLVALLFCMSAYRSRTRLLWADELLCYKVFADPSLLHRLRAWYRGADGGGLLYYLLGSLWFRLFGLSELSLRLFSTAGMGVALVALWATLRRYASTLLTAFCLGVVFFTPPALLWQEVNGRFYGLLFATATVVALLTLYVLEHSRPSRLLLAALFLAHACLVTSHIFGLLFSFSFVVGTLIADRLRHWVRWPVYLLPACSWIFAVISLPATRASGSVAGKFFWTHKPVMADLLFSIAGYGRLTSSLLAVCLGTALLRWVAWQMTGRGRPVRLRPPFAPSVLVASLVLADLLFFAKSQVGSSIFSDRYLLPMLIASALLLAGSLSILLPQSLLRPYGRSAEALGALLVLLPFCWYGATRDVNYSLYPNSSYVPQVNAYLRPGVPALASLPVFPFLHVYDPQHQVLYQTDWGFADDPAHAADYSGERLMENWKRAGYLADDIMPCTELFARYPQVDLLLSPHDYAWFNDRVLHAPDFRVTPVGIVHEWDWVDVYRVDRISAGPPPC